MVEAGRKGTLLGAKPAKPPSWDAAGKPCLKSSAAGFAECNEQNNLGFVEVFYILKGDWNCDIFNQGYLVSDN